MPPHITMMKDDDEKTRPAQIIDDAFTAAKIGSEPIHCGGLCIYLARACFASVVRWGCWIFITLARDSGRVCSAA